MVSTYMGLTFFIFQFNDYSTLAVRKQSPWQPEFDQGMMALSGTGILDLESLTRQKLIVHTYC